MPFLTAMKRGPALGYAGRRDLLTPEIQGDLDLAFMTRIVVGPPWRSLGPGDRQNLVEAFSAYSIATYAQRFKSYSGERFEVDPSPTVLPSGDCIVHTKLFTSDPQPVQLDYLMRKSGDRWRIIDVYLSGTISEMAARRSEYSTVLRQGGARGSGRAFEEESGRFRSSAAGIVVKIGRRQGGRGLPAPQGCGPVLPIEAAERGVEIDRFPLDFGERFEVVRAHVDAVGDDAADREPAGIIRVGGDVAEGVEKDVGPLSNPIARGRRAEHRDDKVRAFPDSPGPQGLAEIPDLFWQISNGWPHR